MVCALWGSFFNVCIVRIPEGRSVASPPSACGACGTRVAFYDNIPIVSYLVLRGKCRHCGTGFSPRYLLVEILTAAVSATLFQRFVLDGLHTGAAVQTGAALGIPFPEGLMDPDFLWRLLSYLAHFLFAGILIVLSGIDMATKRLPDIITLPSIPILYAVGFLVKAGPDWLDRLIGIVAGYLVIRIVSDGYYYLKGREGLGLGDAKLLALMGALLGWQVLPIIIFGASFVGVFASIPMFFLQARGPHPQKPPGPLGDETPNTGDGKRWAHQTSQTRRPKPGGVSKCPLARSFRRPPFSTSCWPPASTPGWHRSVCPSAGDPDLPVTERPSVPYPERMPLNPAASSRPICRLSRLPGRRSAAPFHPRVAVHRPVAGEARPGRD